MVKIELKPEPQESEWAAASESESGINHYHWRVSARQHAWQPPTDVFVTDEAVIVRVEIAGMRDGEFSITFEDQTLTIRGSRFDRPERRAYHQMEIRFGEFRTDVGMHWAVDTNKIDAVYNDGFLRITLPHAKTKNIDIQE